MKGKCKNKCSKNDECEYRKEYLYKYKYNKYKKLYNSDALKIKQIRQLELKYEELLQEKESTNKFFIDRVIAVTTLAVTICTLIKDNTLPSGIGILIVTCSIFFYIIFRAITDHINSKKTEKVLCKMKGIKLEITILKDLLYDQHKIIM